MFDAEKCDLCGKCLEFCPYANYDLNRAQEEMKELVDGGDVADILKRYSRRAMEAERANSKI